MADAAAATSSGGDGDSGRTGELGSLHAIRAVLLAEEAPVFDTEFRQAMAEATDALDLGPVLAFLHRWRRIAASTLADPAAHARMLALGADHAAGRPLPPGQPWAQVKTRLGL